MAATSGAVRGGTSSSVRPQGFTALFLTDLWERFSFFGMMAILFLFATAATGDGGLGLSPADGGALVGLYVSSTFVAAVPGGWLGDRWLGAQRAVLVGTLVIAAGHLGLALPVTAGLPVGLVLLAVGTGLVKPNISALLASCYRGDRQREREAGFALFFMSIQVSALVAPLAVGWVGETVGWHAGFGTAAAGMLVGAATFALGRSTLGATGATPGRPADAGTRRRVGVRAGVGAGVAALLLVVDVAAGTFALGHVLAAVGLLILVTPLLSFRAIARRVTDPATRAGLRAYGRVFASTAVFFLLASQSYSVLSAFARDATERDVGGFTVPASWFQALHPLFVLVVAPVLAALWVGRGRGWGALGKVVVGLVLAAAAFVLMALAAAAASVAPASPAWLVGVEFLLACGEVVLGTAALGVTAAVAPPGTHSQMMGLWWLAGAVGSALGGATARFGVTPGPHQFLYFLALAAVAAGSAALLLMRSRRVGAALGSAAPDVPDRHTARNRSG